MSQSGHAARGGPPTAHADTGSTETPFVPGQGHGMARVNAERAAAAGSIDRSLKAWRKVGGGAPPAAPQAPAAAHKIYRAGEDDFGDLFADSPPAAGGSAAATPKEYKVAKSAITMTDPDKGMPQSWAHDFEAVTEVGKVGIGHGHIVLNGGAPSPDGPQMRLNNVIMHSTGIIKVKGDGFSLTTACLELQEAAYQKSFHQPLGATSGSLIDQNLSLFQVEFAKLRQADARASNDQLAIAAVQKVSFGKSRLELGYKTFTPSIGGMGKSLPPPYQNIDVPQAITFVARK